MKTQSKNKNKGGWWIIEDYDYAGCELTKGMPEGRRRKTKEDKGMTRNDKRKTQG